MGGPAFPRLFLSGCVGFGIGDLALFQAYPRIGSRRTMVMVQCLAAPFAALAEWAWLGTAPTPAQTLLRGRDSRRRRRGADARRDEAQPAHGLIAGILFGIARRALPGLGRGAEPQGLRRRRGCRTTLHGVGDGVNAAYQRLLGGIAVSALFYLYLKFARKPDDAPADWPGAWPWLIANGLAGPALGVTCYQWAL